MYDLFKRYFITLAYYIILIEQCFDEHTIY